MASTHRLCAMCDIAGYGGMSEAEQIAFRSVLFRQGVDALATALQVDRADLHLEDRGDGFFILFPERIQTLYAADMVSALVKGLGLAGSARTRRFRIRMVLGHGPVMTDARGFFGLELHSMARLLDSGAVKARHDMVVLAVTEGFYDQLVRIAAADGRIPYGFHPLSPEPGSIGWVHHGGPFTQEDDLALFPAFRSLVGDAVQRGPLNRRFIARGLITADQLLAGFPLEDAFVEAVRLPSFRPILVARLPGKKVTLRFRFALREVFAGTNPLPEKAVRSPRSAVGPWLEDVREIVVMPLLVQRINTILGAERDVLLVEESSEGLRSLSPDAFVETQALRMVTAALERSTSSSIALAGPRGVGKSTLIERLVTAHAQHGFALQVSAPAGYVPNEFLVHLFQRVCEQVVREGRPPWRERRRPGVAVLAARAAAAALTVLLLWSVGTDLHLKEFPAWATGLWRDHRTLLQGVGAAVAAALWVWPRRKKEPELEVMARGHLERLRYETTTTRSGEATVGQAKLTGSRARKDHRWAMPELVGKLTEFLGAVAAEGRSVLIGIDEVDRIGDVAKAEQFINEIKVVFRVPDCHFVVSVAEEVGSLFARRAIVGRTMFENAFEDVVVVEPLHLDEAAELLQLRVPGYTRPFVYLAYSLSGGLPRELLRVTRRLIEVNNDRRPLPRLPELARLLVRDELREAIDGTRLRLAQLPHEAEWGGLFSDLTARLASFSAESGLNGLSRALTDLADLADLAGPDPLTPAGEALAGLTAFADFGRTAIDVFDRFGLPDVPLATADPALYTRLATARRELSLSPTSCRRILTGIRADVSDA